MITLWIAIALIAVLVIGLAADRGISIFTIENIKPFFKKTFKNLPVILCALILAYALFSNDENTSSSCSSDYKNCKDNADMVNNYSGWFKAQYACKEKLTEIVKYGEPDFKGDGFAFSYFHDGYDYPKKGIATLIAKVAVENEFGVKVNGEQSCEYDFESKKVIHQFGNFNNLGGYFESDDYTSILNSREQQVLKNENLSASTNNQNEQELDKEKLRANSYKLNVEKVKTECRLETQMFYAALTYRFQMHNNVNDADVEQRAIDAARATLNPTNANMDGIKMWANMASGFASQASYEGMVGILANGTSDNEKKCLDSIVFVKDDEGYYYYPKTYSIVNWDNTSNTDWQITCTPQEPCAK